MKLHQEAVSTRALQPPTVGLSDLVAYYKRSTTVVVVGAIDRGAIRRIFEERNREDVLVFVEAPTVHPGGQIA